MKKPVKKPVKKSVTKKPVKKHPPRKVAKAAASKVSTSSREQQHLKESLVEVRSALAQVCELALDAADVLARSRIPEAEEDAMFRQRVLTLHALSEVTPRDRAPVTRELKSGDFVWIGDDDLPEEVAGTPADVSADIPADGPAAEVADTDDGPPHKSAVEAVDAGEKDRGDTAVMPDTVVADVASEPDLEEIRHSPDGT